MKQKLKPAFLAFLTALTFFISSCGNTGTPQTNGQGNAGQSTGGNITGLALPYSASAGFNPYLSDNALTCQSAQLLYCRLITVDPSFNIVYNLAARIETGGTAATIDIETDWHFADGTPITAQDVAASLLAAKTSGLYAARFANVVSVTPIGGGTVAVQLQEADSLFAYLLDVPIMKASETGLRAPTASGRYYVGTTAEGEAAFLQNSFYPAAQNLPADVIALTELSSMDALVGSLNIGDISFYATERETDVAASIANKTAYYKMNNLVYVGFNMGGGSVFSSVALRRAVNAALSRSLICEKAYFARGYVAKGVVNTAYPFAGGAGLFSAEADTAAAAAFLSEAGYTLSAGSPYCTGPGGVVLSVTLLCPAGSTGKVYAANLIKEELAKVGIEVRLVTAENFESYIALLAAGNFDMYIGEVKLYNNMDMAPFFTPGGGAHYGIEISPTLAAAYNAFRQNSDALPAFEEAFAAEIPFAPLLYRCGTLAYNRSLTGVNPSISDLFYEFENLLEE